MVIVNHNGQSVLPALLNSLKTQTFKDFETIVVDNRSTDGSIEEVLKNYEDVRVEVNTENLGYARGLNQGIRRAKGRFLLLLNNDVEIESTVLEALVRFFEDDPSLGIAQPKMVSKQDTRLFDYAGAAGGEIDVLFYPFCRGRIFLTVEEDWHQYDRPVPIFWASGAAFMVRRDVLSKVGLLDEDFFMYHEETDLCWRTKLAGYKVAYVGDWKVFHRTGHAYERYPSGLRFFYMHRNSFYLMLKYERKGRLLLTIPTRLTFEIANVMYSLSNGWTSEALAIVKGMFSALRHSHLMLAKRSALRGIRTHYSNDLGIYPRAIVIDYFLLGKKTYKSLFEA